MSRSRIHPKNLLLELFQEALRAADPAYTLPPHLDDWLSHGWVKQGKGRLIVLAAGKAAGPMSAAVEAHLLPLLGDRLTGRAVTRYGHLVPLKHIKLHEASHPVPDAAGMDATRAIMQLAASASENDRVLALISGGASSLLCMPGQALTFTSLQQMNRDLLRSGLSIEHINNIRKSASGIKGGRLAALISPAPCLSLLVSDVPGDDPGVIGSGPTTPWDGDATHAGNELTRRTDLLSPEVCTLVYDPDRRDPWPATLPATQETRIISTPSRSLAAAATHAKRAGLNVILLGDQIEGEAQTVAAEHAQHICNIINNPNQPLPCVILSGGELTVTHNGGGRGGPNTEYILALAEELQSRRGVHAIACDTDGIDGSEDNAGACLDPTTLMRGAKAGLTPDTHLRRHDSWSFFNAIGDLIVTGPTLTNVNDMRAILILPEARS